jgi:hypothetical protein
MLTAEDFFGTPEYFANRGWTEAAGNGNTRFYAWVQRGPLAVPLYTVLIPASFMLPLTQQTAEASKTELLQSGMRGDNAH